MTAKMLVSVIVPSHNAERWIESALRSVLAQTHRHLEIIAVDDCSTDSTGERLAALADRDRRIRLLRTTRNLGSGSARNLALDAARGDWIALLDADDRYRPDRLERLLDAAGRENVAIVADNLNLVSEHGTWQGLSWPDITAPMIVDAEAFVRGNDWGVQHRFALGYAKPVFKRALVESRGLRYRSDLRIAEDYHFLLSLLLGGERMLVLPDALYDYMQRPDSVSRKPTEQDLTTLLGAIGELRDAAVSEPVRAALERQQRTLLPYLGYAGFTSAVRQRRPVRAAQALAREPRALKLVARYGVTKISGWLRGNSSP